MLRTDAYRIVGDVIRQRVQLLRIALLLSGLSTETFGLSSM